MGERQQKVVHLNDSTACLHHDIEVKPDGNVFAIAWEHFSAEEAIQVGRDSALVPEDACGRR